MQQPVGDDWLGGLDATCLGQHTLDLTANSAIPFDSVGSEKNHRSTKEGNVLSDAQSLTHNSSNHGGEGREISFRTDDAFPNTSSLIFLTLALMTAVFMIALDTNIIGNGTVSILSLLLDT